MPHQSSVSTSWFPQNCFSTLGSSELSFAETLDLAARHQISAIEIRCLSGETIAPDNFSTLFPPVGAALAQLQAAQVDLTSLGTSVKLLDSKTGDIETLVKFAQFADQTQCKWLRIFDGGTIGSLPSPEDWERAQTLVTAWQSRRKELGLNAEIMIETHDGLTSVPSVVLFRQKLPQTALLWDSHHTWRAGGESLSDYYTAARDAIVHIHVKDSIDKPSARKSFTYCLPGQGEFPWEQLKPLVRDDQFSGKLSLEWERHWHPYLAPLAEALPPYQEILASW